MRVDDDFFRIGQGLLGFSRETDEKRAHGSHSGLMGALNAAMYVLYPEILAHSFKHGVIPRLDAEKNAAAAGLGHQIRQFRGHVIHPAETGPLNGQFRADNFTADIFGPLTREGERRIDKTIIGDSPVLIIVPQLIDDSGDWMQLCSGISRLIYVIISIFLFIKLTPF